MRLASRNKIEKLSNKLYLVGDKEYYILLDNIGKAKPVVRGSGKEQELLIPLISDLTYPLLF